MPTSKSHDLSVPPFSDVAVLVCPEVFLAFPPKDKYFSVVVSRKILKTKSTSMEYIALTL